MGTGDATASRLFGIDYRSLRLFRMGLAILLLGDLVARSVDLDAFYTDAGVLPRSLLRIPGLRFSFHAMAGGRRGEEVLFLMAAAFALLLLAGVWPRVSAIASWLFLASLDARNPLVLNHGDELLKIFLFWSIFVPLTPCQRPSQGGAGKRHLSVFTAALVLQVCIVYFFSALLKTDNSWSVTGTAIASALSLEQLSTGFGRALLDRPNLLRIATLLVYYLELLGPLLIFVPWSNRRIREVAIVAFVAMHLAIAATMSLGLFPWVSILGWVLILPSETLDWIQGALGIGMSVPAQAASGNAPRGSLLGTGIQVLGAYLLCAVLIWNIRCLGTKPEELHPSSLDAPLLAAQLDQRWNMFAPRPNYISGWYVAPADLADGSHVDLMNVGKPVSWTRPDIVAATYPDFRWRKYLINIGLSRFEGYGPGLSPYLRRHWDETHSASQKVRQLKVCFVWQDLSAGENPPVRNTVISKY
jgi:hypothetical protein